MSSGSGEVAAHTRVAAPCSGVVNVWFTRRPRRSSGQQPSPSWNDFVVKPSFRISVDEVVVLAHFDAQPSGEQFLQQGGREYVVGEPEPQMLAVHRRVHNADGRRVRRIGSPACRARPVAAGVALGSNSWITPWRESWSRASSRRTWSSWKPQAARSRRPGVPRGLAAWRRPATTGPARVLARRGCRCPPCQRSTARSR